MSKLRRGELQRFFHDLEKWNRVVVRDAKTGETAKAGAEPQDREPRAERHIFIRVSCDTDLSEPRANAKLA